jgi:hypothetical protein
MSTEPRLSKVAAERIHLPPMRFADTFDWDGVSTMVRPGEPMTSSQRTLPSGHAALSLTQGPVETPCQLATGGHARPSWTRGDLCPVRSAVPRAIDWAREAARLTVALDPGLLLATARDMIPGVTGELV